MSPADAEAHLLADLDQTTLADALRAVPRSAGRPTRAGRSARPRAGRRMAGPPVRSPHAAQEPAVCGAVRDHADPWHWRQHGDVQRRSTPCCSRRCHFPTPIDSSRSGDSKPEAGWSQNSLTHANFWDMRDMVREFSDVAPWTTFTSIGHHRQPPPADLPAVLLWDSCARSASRRSPAGCSSTAKTSPVTTMPWSCFRTGCGSRVSAPTPPWSARSPDARWQEGGHHRRAAAGYTLARCRRRVRAARQDRRKRTAAASN